MNHPEERDIANMGKRMTYIAWIIAFVLLAILYKQIEDREQRARKARLINPNQTVSTRTTARGTNVVILKRNYYGHYVSNGKINNASVYFMLDTGATEVGIPLTVAKRLGLKKGRAVTISTAQGNSTAYRTRVRSLELGKIRVTNIPALIMPLSTDNKVLLGMRVLKDMELIQRGNTLTIKQIVK